ncbi:hypothetical protein [Steroidobacter gossypii]|uniref:hypothetical protein n=1 Tax=Steroidobacter gossypii TaxID=2805490 RepID=UPI001E4708B2|nr:hypothetical protein [Steroidobacter gossypii]
MRIDWDFPRVSLQGIVALATHEHIVATTAEQVIVAIAAVEEIVAGRDDIFHEVRRRAESDREDAREISHEIAGLTAVAAQHVVAGPAQ